MVRSDAFIAFLEFAADAQVIAVVGGIGVLDPFRIFRPLGIKAKFRIFPVDELIAGASDAVPENRESPGILQEEGCEFFFCSFHAAPGI